LLAYDNHLPSEFRLIPARAGLKAVAVPQGRNIQAGIAILNLRGSEISMQKSFVLSLLLWLAIFAVACGSSTETNSNVNVNQTVGTGNVTVDPNNLPEGLSASPIPPSANTTPGIPDPKNANAIPKGATPTPGIPSPADLKKPFKPGATPTPGIPSPEELRRQMQRSTNVNVNAQPPAGDEQMMMKSRKSPRPVNKP
jgi:hypothetical protein